MVLETLSPSNEFSNFIIYDTITAEASSGGGGYLENIVSVSHQRQQQHQQHDPAACDNNCDDAVMMMKKTSTRKRQCCSSEPETSGSKVQSNNKKRRRRKARVCKNKEEAETQRITHITVERNRRKQMNEHLAVLRSLMPESYVQRGDQASIVGGAIEFVKELEHLLQSLEARKLQLLQQQVAAAAQQAQNNNTNNEDNNNNNNNNVAISKLMLQQPPFAQFFVYPQYTWSQTPNKYTSKTKAAIADIEVTLIETHANLRILTRIIRPGQLTKIVAGFQTLCLTILHLNVTAIDPLVFYSISAKVEEGFQLGSVEGIATAVHNLLERIEEEASLCC